MNLFIQSRTRLAITVFILYFTCSCQSEYSEYDKDASLFIGGWSLCKDDYYIELIFKHDSTAILLDSYMHTADRYSLEGDSMYVIRELDTVYRFKYNFHKDTLILHGEMDVVDTLLRNNYLKEGWLNDDFKKITQEFLNRRDTLSCNL